LSAEFRGLDTLRRKLRSRTRHTDAKIAGMDTPDRAALQRIASECVALVAEQHDRRLDWTAESLTDLDEVCAELLAGGPLPTDRLDLWWKLVGAYTGEVLIRTHGGTWINHEKAGGAYAISVRGLTAFPFTTADRVLHAEPFKSLASFVRSMPAIAEHSRHNPPAG
jgi:hypothetical protein